MSENNSSYGIPQPLTDEGRRKYIENALKKYPFWEYISKTDKNKLIEYYDNNNISPSDAISAYNKLEELRNQTYFTPHIVTYEENILDDYIEGLDEELTRKREAEINEYYNGLYGWIDDNVRPNNPPPTSPISTPAPSLQYDEITSHHITPPAQEYTNKTDSFSGPPVQKFDKPQNMGIPEVELTDNYYKNQIENGNYAPDALGYNIANGKFEKQKVIVEFIEDKLENDISSYKEVFDNYTGKKIGVIIDGVFFAAEVVTLPIPGANGVVSALSLGKDTVEFVIDPSIEDGVGLGIDGMGRMAENTIESSGPVLKYGPDALGTVSQFSNALGAISIVTDGVEFITDIKELQNYTTVLVPASIDIDNLSEIYINEKEKLIDAEYQKAYYNPVTPIAELEAFIRNNPNYKFGNINVEMQLEKIKDRFIREGYDLSEYSSRVMKYMLGNDSNSFTTITAPEQAMQSTEQRDANENNYFNLRGLLDSKGYTYNDYTTLSKYLGSNDKAINAMKTKDKTDVMRMILLQKDKTTQPYMPSQQNISSSMGGNSWNVTSDAANEIAKRLSSQAVAQNSINNILNYSDTKRPYMPSQQNISSSMGGNSWNVSSEVANDIAEKIAEQYANYNNTYNVPISNSTDEIGKISEYDRMLAKRMADAARQENISPITGGNSGNVSSSVANIIANKISEQSAAQNAVQEAINNIQNYSQTANPPAVSQENISSNMGGNSGMVDSAMANAIADAIAAQSAMRNTQNFSGAKYSPVVSQENISRNMGGNSGMVDSARANAIADAIASKHTKSSSNNSHLQGTLANEIEKKRYSKKPFRTRM